MSPLTIAYIQTALFWEDIPANLAMLEEKIWKLDKVTDLIVLPEMFSTGFSMNAVKLAEPMNSTTFKWMKQQASQRNAAITGSYIVKENGSYYNRLIWMLPDGTFYKYDKHYLFGYGGETDVYTAGKDKLIVTWRGWKIMPLICFDLRFPGWSRNKCVKNEKEYWEFDYDLLIYVANWPESRMPAWNALLKARAVENSSYVLGVNVVGKDGRDFSYVGNSQLVDPLVNILSTGEDKDGIFYHELDFEFLKRYRDKFPFLQAEHE